MDACNMVRTWDLLNFSSSGAEGQRLREGKQQVKGQAGHQAAGAGPFPWPGGPVLINKENWAVGAEPAPQASGAAHPAAEPRPVAFG